MTVHGRGCDCDECFLGHRRRKMHAALADMWRKADVDDADEIVKAAIDEALLSDPLTDESELRRRAQAAIEQTKGDTVDAETLAEEAIQIASRIQKTTADLVAQRAELTLLCAKYTDVITDNEEAKREAIKVYRDTIAQVGVALAALGVAA